jgi:hypothetical protein
MDLKKVSGVLKWPTPVKVKHVQAFLGFANLYRRFIMDFAKIAQPLTHLTMDNLGHGTRNAEKAFTLVPIS